MRYKLAIFDLDGTILDTLDDLMDSLNAALAKSGFPVRTREEVRAFVGSGIRKLIERGVPAGTAAHLQEKVYRDFSAYYKDHSTDKTRPYEGVPELLRALRAAGCQTAVLSNKSDTAVQELCQRFFGGLFDMAFGERTGVPRKPAPDAVFEILSSLKCEKADAVYIGDSEVDVELAKNAGLDAVLVDWGFRDRLSLLKNGAAVLASTPAEVYALL